MKVQAFHDLLDGQKLLREPVVDFPLNRRFEKFVGFRIGTGRRSLLFLDPLDSSLALVLAKRLSVMLIWTLILAS